MKSKFNKIIALAIVVINCQLSIINCKAQTIPGAVNFQAIARGASGNVLTNTVIQVRVSILDGSSSGAVLGSYTYQKTTDGYGQFTVAIGTDATVATSGAALSVIDWTAASRWIKVEFQPGTSGGFTLISNSEATASFYSFAAKTAAGLSIAGSSGDVLKHNGTTWVAGTDAGSTFTAPTIQKFTTGSGTYTTPAGVKYIRVRMVGGGGGGCTSATNPGTSATSGSSGQASTFGSSLLNANGGSGALNSTNGLGGLGGTASIGSAIGSAITGGYGQVGIAVTTVLTYSTGGSGGSSPYFGGGGSAETSVQTGNTKNGLVNTGGGGGGASGNSNTQAGGGGGSGGFVDAIINSPTTTYSYQVGLGGTATSPAGSGGSGVIIVEEYYQ